MDALHERPPIGAGGQLATLDCAIDDHLSHGEAVGPQALTQLVEILIGSTKAHRSSMSAVGSRSNRGNGIGELDELGA